MEGSHVGWDPFRDLNLQGISPPYDVVNTMFSLDDQALLNLNLGLSPNNVPNIAPIWQDQATALSYVDLLAARNTMPWCPLRVAPANANIVQTYGPQPIPNDDRGVGYQVWPPSGPSVQPSESGYVTQAWATGSVENPSHVADYTSQPRASDSRSMVSDTISSRSTKSREHLGRGKVRCDSPGCTWEGKCPSDRKKHKERQKRRYKCEDPNCRNKRGFGTINDLCRHEKSVHGKDPRRGPKKVYKCFARRCDKKDKHWPRLDNFKAHLEKRHGKDHDVKKLLEQSDKWYAKMQKDVGMDRLTRDDVSEVQQPLGPSEAGDDFVPKRCYTVDPNQTVTGSQLGLWPEDFKHRGFNQSVLGPISETLGFQGQPAEWQALVGLGTGNSNHPGQNNFTLQTNFTDRQVLVDEATKASSQWQPAQQTDEGVEMAYPDLKSDEIELAGPPLAHLSPTSPNPNSARSHQAVDFEMEAGKQDWLQCEYCEKRARRPCEMRKHQKRHERPYGCTFDGCYSTFGSKNDWRRHESSQHSQLERWRCGMANLGRDDGPCALLFSRQEVYEQHLRNQHHIVDQYAVQAFLTKNHLGENYRSQFWCGFCRDILPHRGRGSDASKERSTHIDSEHFKKGQQIGDWLPLAGHLTKGQILQRDTSRHGRADGNSRSPLSDEDVDSKVSGITTSGSNNGRKRRSPTTRTQSFPGGGDPKKKGSELPSRINDRGQLRAYCCQCQSDRDENGHCLICPHSICGVCRVT